MRAVFVFVLVPAACLACGDNLPPLDPDDTTVPTESTLFSETRVWDIEIHLDAAAVADLGANPDEYVQGDVAIGGLVFDDAGVRLKGTFSFRPLSSKAAFKIRLDRFVPGQSLGTIHRLTLNNMWQSRSALSEWLGYEIFALAGAPAPRSGYARVWVNGELYGLYANVETEDEFFLARHFEVADGNLYEAELTDVVDEEIPDFEQEQGEDRTRADLYELAAAVAAPGDGLFFDDPPLLDTDALVAFVAGEAVIGHWDGYWKAHNYRLYRDPGDGRWRFLPWGIDQAFERRLDPFSGAGVVTLKCMASDRCLALYAAAARALALAVDGGDLAARLDRVIELIGPTLDVDERMPYGPDKVRRHQAAIRDYLRHVPGDLAARLDCTDDDGELDRDGDTYGDCVADCDPDSAAAHPGAPEVCDDRDNDCDGLVDDLAGCGCEVEAVAGRTLIFCVHPMPWVAARAHCGGQGAELARFDDASAARAAFDAARAHVSDHWYFALNDRVEEGAWLYGDDAAPAFEDWASDEPDSFGEEDCAVLDEYASGAWSDVRCAEPHPFVCQPLPGAW